jgi:hypothetical protein
MIGTLAGNSMLGPMGSHSTALKELEDLRKERLRKITGAPVAPGEVGSVSGVAENADAYILIRRAKNPEDEERKEEGMEEDKGEDKEKKKVLGLF